MPKQILTGKPARDALQNGVRALADVVGATMGPRGRNVAIASQGYGQPPFVTNDGVTIAQSIVLADPVQDMAAQFVKQVASRANETAGDGTTTAVVLAAALLDAARTQIELTDVNPVQLQQQLLLVQDWLLQELDTQAVPVQGNVDLLKAVAHLSAGSDAQVGDLLASLFDRMGPSAAVTLEDSAEPGVFTEIIEGLTLESGWLMPHFITEGRTQTATVSDAYCLIVDRDLADPRALQAVMEHVAQTLQDKRLVVFCKNMREGALATAVVNTAQQNFYSLVVKLPASLDHADLAALTGATVITEADGVDLKTLDPDDYLGKVTKVVATRTRTTVVGAADPAVLDAHVASLQEQAADATTEATEAERTALRTRASKLQSGVGVVRVGATTEVARLERKLRVEDAINATAAALQSGVLPGGGAALAHLAARLRTGSYPTTLDPQAASIMARVLEEPMRRIATNAGREAATIIAHVQAQPAPTATYDAATHTHAPDAVAAGIADPALVTTTALEAAVGAVSTLITTHATVTDAPKEDTD